MEPPPPASLPALALPAAPPLAPAAIGTPARRPRATLWALRLLLTAHLLAVLTQPVLAGRYLAGDVDAIEVHGSVGSLLPVLTLAVGAAAVGYVAVARSRWWLLPVVVALFLAEGLQIGMGFARVLSVHVPLGVVIGLTAALLAVWAWTPAAARPRRLRATAP